MVEPEEDRREEPFRLSTSLPTAEVGLMVPAPRHSKKSMTMPSIVGDMKASGSCTASNPAVMRALSDGWFRFRAA